MRRHSKNGRHLVAGLNARPGHFSAAEYYRAPVDNLRTYPVYYPGREPAGYWDMLQAVGPKPLIEPAALSSDAEWARAGKRVFEEWDVPGLRVYDPQALAAARRADTFARARVRARPDGTLPDLRWVPTDKGMALGLANCAACHTRLMNDGTLLHGAPPNEDAESLRSVQDGALGGVAGEPGRRAARPDVLARVRRRRGSPTTCTTRSRRWRRRRWGRSSDLAFAVGLFPRWNGSVYYPTKIPDLIGIKDRKYIDHTATHHASRAGRSDALCGARHLQRLLRLRTAPHAQRRAAHGAVAGAGRSCSTRSPSISTRCSRRPTRTRPIRGFPRGSRSSRAKAAATATRRRSTPTTS